MSKADIPDAWPPADQDLTRQIVPLFPLPDVWLFPYLILPLHIFEPRYQQMIQDGLDGPGRLVLGTVCEGSEGDLAGSPPVYPIAGLGEIARHEKLPDGRFQVMLVGLRRVLLREVSSDKLYRQVEIEPALEIPLSRDREEELRLQLTAALGERSSQAVKIPRQVPTSHLADLLILHTPLPHAVMNRLFSDLDLERRALQALEEHAARPHDENSPSPGRFLGGMFRGGEPSAEDEPDAESESD